MTPTLERVAEIIEVSDPSDPRLREYTDLRDMSLRKLLEADRGVFLAEGEKVIRRALETGHKPRSFLMAQRWVEPLSDVLAANDASCFVLGEQQIESVTGFHVHRGALAVFERPAPRTPESILAEARRVVVVEDLADHTNLGAIFRSIAALGWDGVLLSPRCADPLYRRSIKVAMGSVFWLPYARVEDWYSLPDLLRTHDFTSYAMTLTPDAVALRDVVPTERVALLVGSEGHGLSQRWESGADVRVTIPMRAGIDSLNVAASVAIAAHQLALT